MRTSAVAAMLLLAARAEAWQMEVGTATVGATRRVAFDTPFPFPPAVFALPVEGEDDAVAVRIFDVTPTDFALMLIEPAAFDGPHAPARVSFLAIEPGRWVLPDGAELEVGFALVAAAQHAGFSRIPREWAPLAFFSRFDRRPAVLLQLQTMDSELAAPPLTIAEPFLQPIARTVTSTGLELALELGDRVDNEPLGLRPEIVAVFSIDAPMPGRLFDRAGAAVRYEAMPVRAVRGWDDGCSAVPFAAPYPQAPRVFGALVSRRDRDGGWLRRCAIGTVEVRLGVDEDTILDLERSHGPEDASVVVFERAFAAELGEVDLALTIDDGRAEAAPDSAYDYTIVIRNRGPSAVDTVDLAHVVPALLSGVGFAESRGAFDPTSGAWTGLGLVPTSSASLRVTGTLAPLARGSLSLAATVAPRFVLERSPADNAGLDTTPIGALADLAIEVLPPGPIASAGAAFEVLYRVRNLGPHPVGGFAFSSTSSPNLSARGSTVSAGRLAGGMWTGLVLRAGELVTLAIDALARGPEPSAGAHARISAPEDRNPANDRADFVVALCGQGTITAPETCDDGNETSGDGCSACRVDVGFACAGAPSVCAPICGDGLLLGAACDDANRQSGDGCSGVCELEPGWLCAGEPSACNPTCGDGLIRGSEECDAAAPDSGCAGCRVAIGHECGGEPSICAPVCGDGLLAGQACDDGNGASGDGCAACAVEAGFACAGEPSVCARLTDDADGDGFPDQLGLRGGGHCQSGGGAIWLVGLLAWRRRKR